MPLKVISRIEIKDNVHSLGHTYCRESPNQSEIPMNQAAYICVVESEASRLKLCVA